MPRHSASKGDFVSIKVEGYVVYNTGGGFGITNDPKVVETRKFDRDKGKFYFDIPEYMITEVSPAHPWTEGTIARITIKGATKDLDVVVIGRYSTRIGEDYWLDPNTDKPLRIPRDHTKVKIEPLWDREGNY